MLTVSPTSTDTPASFAARELDAMRRAAAFGIDLDALPERVKRALAPVRTRQVAMTPNAMFAAIRALADPDNAGGGDYAVFTAGEIVRAGIADCKGFTVLATALGNALGYPPVRWCIYGHASRWEHVAPVFRDVTGADVVVDGMADMAGQVQNGGIAQACAPVAGRRIA